MRGLAAFTLIAVICGGLIGGVFSWTEPHIRAAEAAVRLQRLAEVIGADSAPLELETDGRWLCPALRVETVIVRGYGGELELLIAIDASHTVAGLRIVRHSETPGIGDFIEVNPASDSSWPDAQRGLDAATLDEIDAVSGATVTVRAVRQALRIALEREGCA